MMEGIYSLEIAIGSQSHKVHGKYSKKNKPDECGSTLIPPLFSLLTPC